MIMKSPHDVPNPRSLVPLSSPGAAGQRLDATDWPSETAEAIRSAVVVESDCMGCLPYRVIRPNGCGIKSHPRTVIGHFNCDRVIEIFNSGRVGPAGEFSLSVPGNLSFRQVILRPTYYVMGSSLPGCLSTKFPLISSFITIPTRK